MSQTGGCRCGCGGHGKQNNERTTRDQPAGAPTVTQPLGEDYQPAVARTSSEEVDPVAIAAAVTTAMGGAAPQGVAAGHKAGNLLGLRDISAAPASTGGACGCGGH